MLTKLLFPWRLLNLIRVAGAVYDFQNFEKV